MKINNNKEIKTIITDFDETLWTGVVAEGEQPKLNRAYYDYLVNLFHKGVVLFGLTKNDEKDTERAFKVLKIDKNIFVTIISNWESKAHNINLLYQQLELRADTTLFIDDNPLELNEVKLNIPEIMVLNARDWKNIKVNKSLKKTISAKKSITERYHKYRHALQLHKTKQTFKGTDESFLYSRHRSIQIGTPKITKELERVAELFYRTNRLNINKRPLSSIKEAMNYLKDLQESGYCIYAISVKDGGESLGIQAGFTAIQRGKKILIANGTISCSMISFGDFEKKILNELLKQFFQTADSVEILVKETPTNQRIREVLKNFNFRIKKQHKSEYQFCLNKKDFKEHDIPWIKVETRAKVSYEYFGVPPVKDYFQKHEWNQARPNSKVVALGIGQGETLGATLTQKYTKHLQLIHAQYYPIDIEHYGTNIVANAEDLHKIFKNESVDYIICTELLEHTEHYWKIINEMLRILKIHGRIFLSVPYNYPPHEYPIDKWRLSYSYLQKIFSPWCIIKKVKFIGSKDKPRHIIMSLIKTNTFTIPIKQAKGEVDWETGLTYIK